jgi:hypothetical protein
MEQLIALNPSLLSGLSLEGNAYVRNKQLLDQYIASLRTKAEEEARSAVRSEALQRALKAQADYRQAAAEFNALPKPVRINQMAASTSNKSNPLYPIIKMDEGKYGDVQKAQKEYTDAMQLVQATDKAIETSIRKTAKTIADSASDTKTEVKNLIASFTDVSSMSVQDIEDQIEKIEGLRKTLKQGDAELKIFNDRIKALSTQKTHLEGGQTSEEKSAARAGQTAENKLRRLREQIAAIKNEMQGVQRDIERGDQQADQREIARVMNKYARLLAEAKKYAAEYAELTQLQQQELDALFQKQFADRSGDEYEDTLKSITSYFQSEKEKTHQSYLDGEITRAQHSLAMKRLEKEEYEARAQAALDYAATVKKAEEDASKFKAESKERQIAEVEGNKESAAQGKVDFAQSRVNASSPGTLNELNAHKDLLKAKFEQDTMYMDKSSTAYQEAQDALHQNLASAEKQYWGGVVDQVMGYLQAASDLFSGFNEIQNNKEEAALQRDKDRNDEKKKNLKRQLDGKKISRATYDNEINKMDAEMEKREKEQKRREAKRAKAAALFQAIINTAGAVARAFVDYKWPYSLIVAAIAGALGGVQIAKISSQNDNIGRKGLIVPGPSHEEGGVDLIERRSGKTLANVEGGEPLWVFSKNTYRNNKDILDELIYNSMNKNGARIGAGKWYQKNDQQINTARIIPLMRNGGVIGDSSGTSTDMSETNALIAQMIYRQDATIQELSTMKTKLKAVVAIKDIDEQQDLLKKARSVAGINQAA